MSLFGIKGVPLKVDKLNCLGTPQEVCEHIKDIAKGMKKPMVMQVNNNIAVFDIYMDDSFDLEIRHTCSPFGEGMQVKPINSDLENG